MVLDLLAQASGIGHPVNEQNTGEMVHFVLNASGHQAIGFHGSRPPHLIAKTHLNGAGAHHIQIHPWNTQATFLVGVEACTGRDDLRIDEHQRWRAGCFRIQINHKQLLVNANLGSRQADASGRVHAAQHVARQITHGFIHLADAPGIQPQHVVSEGMDLQRRSLQRLFRNGHRRTRLLGRSCQLGKAPGQDLSFNLLC